MKVLICITKRDGEIDRVKRTKELLEQEHVPVELIDVDTAKNKYLKELYDVISTPQILVLSEDGHAIKQWYPEDFPVPVGDIKYFVGLQSKQLFPGAASRIRDITKRPKTDV